MVSRGQTRLSHLSLGHLVGHAVKKTCHQGLYGAALEKSHKGTRNYATSRQCYRVPPKSGCHCLFFSQRPVKGRGEPKCRSVVGLATATVQDEKQHCIEPDSDCCASHGLLCNVCHWANFIKLGLYVLCLSVLAVSLSLLRN